MNNAKELINAFICERETSKSILGLTRVLRLLELLDNPQDKINYVHLVGTNGKGSTCSFMASIFTSSGYKVGMFTSPPLIELNEQIRINNENIGDEEFANVIKEVNYACDKMAQQGYEYPTFFERITACAFKAFSIAGVDIAFIEAGLGGSGDSTNVGHPLMVIITSISFDHQQILGNTIAKITSEKAAVIKQKSNVVLAKQDYAEAIDVIKKKCDDEDARLNEASNLKSSKIISTRNNTTFHLQTENNYYDFLTINLLGKHQVDNAITSIMACECLKKQYTTISKETIIKGLDLARWNGRIQKLDDRVIFDGAHNAKSATSLSNVMCDLFSHSKIILLTGSIIDKDVEKMSTEFTRFADYVIVTEPKTNKDAFDCGQLLEIYKNKASNCMMIKDVRKALTYAKEILKNNKDYTLVIAGSLYLAKDVNDFWEFNSI